METYIFPVAYFISDDSDVQLSQWIVQAENIEKAKEQIVKDIKAYEKSQLGEEYADEEDEEIGIPSIWFELDEEDDEEGYIIGKPLKLAFITTEIL